jgi:hypothetical protein
MIRTAVLFLRVAAASAVVLALCACNGSTGSATGPAAAAAAAAAQTTPSTPGTVSLSSASYSVAQSAGSLSVTVARAGTATSAVSVDYSTSDGTAAAGTDYTSTSGTLNWAENDSTPKTISVPISSATPHSDDRSFTVVLSNPSAAVSLASPGSATVTISGEAASAVGALQLSAASYAIAQSAGTLTVTVTRTSGSSGSVSVGYATADGTAVAGTDYTAAKGTLQWADGDAVAKTVSIPISNASPFSGSKTFSVTLSGPSAMATIGNPNSATVTIAGGSSASAGSFQLSKASYPIAQNVGTVAVSVNRTGGSSGAASVAYTTTNGTAVAGTDFTAASGTLNWANGDTAAKTVAVTVSNAAPFSGNKTFSVALSSPSALATVSSPGSATVTIAGDGAAAAGSLELSSSTYSVAQNAGSTTVTVNRTGGSSGAASVAYKTTSGTAVAGTDFTATSGTLTWAAGDAAAKTFSVAVSNASPFSGSKTFGIGLSGATGATLGNPGTATVGINGDAQVAVGSIQLSASSYSVAQSSGSLTVTVNRTGGSSGAVSVAYETTAGSATAGTDYTPASGTLQWGDGNAAAKTFSVPVSNGTAFSGSKTFSVAISSPTGGATLSNPSTATATINGSGSSSSGVKWMYLDGAKTLAGDFTGGGETTNYQNSTTSGYNGGTMDIRITSSVPWGYFIPYWASNYQLPNLGYTYLLLSIKPSITGDTFGIHAERDGDSPLPGIELVTATGNSYGPAAVAGQWASYKIPLKDLGVFGDPTLYKVVMATHTGTADSWEMDAIGFQ